MALMNVQCPANFIAWVWVNLIPLPHHKNRGIQAMLSRVIDSLQDDTDLFPPEIKEEELINESSTNESREKNPWIDLDDDIHNWDGDADNSVEEGKDSSIKVAIIGRPNVGKSTLVNRFLGEERVVVFDMPGTTRDSIFIPFERDGQKIYLHRYSGYSSKTRCTRGD